MRCCADCSDAADNFLCVAGGVKIVHLYPASVLPAMHPFSHQQDTSALYKSQVRSRLRIPHAQCPGARGLRWRPLNAASFDDRFPRFRSAPCFTASIYPGDALYIPCGWWHEVMTPEITTAYNVWFTPSEKSRFRKTILHLYSPRILPFLEKQCAGRNHSCEQGCEASIIVDDSHKARSHRDCTTAVQPQPKRRKI